MRTVSRAELVGDEPEKLFMLRVKRRAEFLGWTVFHTLDSLGTRSGEPDLRMIRPPRYVLAELKSQHGRLSPSQREIKTKLEHCPGVEMYEWRPSDWEAIVRVLS